MKRVAPDATAFAQRDARYLLNAIGSWIGPDANDARMLELKRRFDPSNVFRLNQNVRPEI